MSPEFHPTPQEEQEACLTALLLDQLPEDQAAEVRAAIKRDPELARLCQRLKLTIELVHAAAAVPAEQAAAPTAPLKLSRARREQLLTGFKTIAPKPFMSGKRDTSWSVIAVAAALALLLACSALLLPSLGGRSNFLGAQMAATTAPLARSSGAVPEGVELSFHAKEKRDETAGRRISGSSAPEGKVAADRVERFAYSDTDNKKDAGFLYETANRGPVLRVELPKLAEERLSKVPPQRALREGGRTTLAQDNASGAAHFGIEALPQPAAKPAETRRFYGGFGGAGGASSEALSRSDPNAVKETAGKPIAEGDRQAPGQDVLRRDYFAAEVAPAKPEAMDESKVTSLGAPAAANTPATTLSYSVLTGTADPAAPPPPTVAAGLSIQVPAPVESRLADVEANYADKLARREEAAKGAVLTPNTSWDTTATVTATNGLVANNMWAARPNLAGGAWVDYDRGGLADLFDISGERRKYHLTSNADSFAPDGSSRLEGRTSGGTPVLGDLPMLGKMFRSQTQAESGTQSERREPATASGGTVKPTIELKGLSQTGDKRVLRRAEVAQAAGAAPIAGDALAAVPPASAATAASPAVIPPPEPETKVRPAAPALAPQPEVAVTENRFSTFSLNVADVSFRLAEASLRENHFPDAASIRTEEFINAFDYNDPEPGLGQPIAFAWERARYPFAHDRELVRFSIKTAAQGRAAGRPLSLVLLLDNSGSMERADRAQIIREALKVLGGQLQPQDKLSLVTFSRTARLWAEAVPGNQAQQVLERVAGLTPEGGTNLEEAMRLAYQTAQKVFIPGGVNRVVLLTDGAANLGNVDPAALKAAVEQHRRQGIALDCFGIGWEGYNDDLLETLARNGDGRYGFINTPEEASTEFAAKLAGALQVAASDVKVQVEFNPARVIAYRQLGYAKHQLTKEQFRDNTVDAAEIGAAESGNALYVLQVKPGGRGPLGVVRVRYKVPGTTDYREQEWPLPALSPAPALDQASPAMRLAACASAFSEWLVSSPYAGEITPDGLLRLLAGVPALYAADPRPGKLEWMIRQAKSISGQ